MSAAGPAREARICGIVGDAGDSVCVRAPEHTGDCEMRAAFNLSFRRHDPLGAKVGPTASPAFTSRGFTFGHPAEAGQSAEGALSKIAEYCDELKALLRQKCKSYGNSALDPMRLLSRADATEQLRVRADDKLSRLRQDPNDREAILDLAGYLVLLLIAIDEEPRCA